jgi:Mor family transcriptional regulator
MKKTAPNAKTERNLEIYKDYQDGMLGVDMVVKYRISTQAIHKIIERVKRGIDNRDK